MGKGEHSFVSYSTVYETQSLVCFVIVLCEHTFKYYQRACAHRREFRLLAMEVQQPLFCNPSIRTDWRLLPLLPYILTVYQTQDSSQGHWIETRREDWPVLASEWCLKATGPHFSGTSVGYVGGTGSGGACNRCTSTKAQALFQVLEFEIQDLFEVGDRRRRPKTEDGRRRRKTEDGRRPKL